MKYKLIKTYPGSPKLGTEALPLEDIYWYKDNMGCSQTLRNIKAYPEYWQEVIEKDYEILSFKNPEINIIIPKHPNNLFGIYFGEFTEKDQLDKIKNKRIPKIIYSIKRLSDGEIFTVGDKIDGFTYKDRTLEKIELRDNKLVFIQKFGITELKHLKHSKQPLFKTEDGVEIFDLYKDSFYYVRFTKSDYHNPLWEILVVDQSLDFKYEPEVEKYFSTKKAAEEYVIMNKPCLSINDVAKVYTSANHVNSSYPHAGKIRNLVKQKLGL